MNSKLRRGPFGSNGGSDSEAEMLGPVIVVCVPAFIGWFLFVHFLHRFTQPFLCIQECFMIGVFVFIVGAILIVFLLGCLNTEEPTDDL